MLENAHRLRKELVDAGIRVKMDERDGMSPGFKFNDWEMRGVPLRLELGPKDVAKGIGRAGAARPSRQGREDRSCRSRGLPRRSSQLLEEIQKSLHDRALEFRKAHTVEPADYGEFKKAVETGFAFAWWCGSADCEAKIKEETKATMRCIPLEQPGGSGQCILCGKAFARKRHFRSSVLTKPYGRSGNCWEAPFTHRKQAFRRFVLPRAMNASIRLSSLFL